MKSSYHDYNEISDALNNMLNDSLKNNEEIYEIPSFFGKGFCKRQIINDYFHIYTNNLEVYEEVQMAGQIKRYMYILSFPMSDGMIWEDKENRTCFIANNNDILLHQIDEFSANSIYIPNKAYKGVNINIAPWKFQDLKDSLSNNRELFRYKTSNFKMNQFKGSLESQLIINQILDCPYKGKIRDIYLEGKVMEVIAVSFHQLIADSIYDLEKMDISRSDIETLYKAKDILDNSITSPPTLKVLSKKICLNEFKLKTGFKKLFGKPVYSYVLDKRMELACFFLETKGMKVSEVANLIGYSNGNNFSRAFKKIYGFNPSEYLSNKKIQM